MRYRFNYSEERMVVSRIAKDYEIDRPECPRWADDWEWSYDFDEIFTNIKLQISLWLFGKSLILLRWLGAEVRRGVPTYGVETKYVDVDTDRIFDAVYEKLTEYQRRKCFDNCMILVGGDALQEVRRVESPFVFQQHVRAFERVADRNGYKLLTHWFDVPVYFLPDFVGIAVIPDITGGWRRYPPVVGENKSLTSEQTFRLSWENAPIANLPGL